MSGELLAVDLRREGLVEVVPLVGLFVGRFTDRRVVRQDFGVDLHVGLPLYYRVQPLEKYAAGVLLVVAEHWY